MMQDRIRALRLPAEILDGIDHLCHELAKATTRDDIEREASMQGGFILGLETARLLRPADIEMLYIIFDDAVRERLASLGTADRQVLDGPYAEARDWSTAR